MADDTSSFLMNRAKAAKARATSKPQTVGKPPRVELEPVATASSAAPKPEQKTNRRSKPADQRTGSPKSDASANESENALREPAAAEISPLALQDAQVIELFRQHSPNSAAFELFRPSLPAIVRTLISGAQIRGAPGHQDRMTIFRMLGAPWTPTAGLRGETGNNLDALADRLVSAVARRERRLLGPPSVTLDAEFTEEPAPVAA